MANKEKVVDNTTITNKEKVDVVTKSPTKTISTTTETKETTEQKLIKTQEEQIKAQQKMIDIIKDARDGFKNQLRDIRLDLFTGVIKQNPKKGKGIFKLIKEKY